MVPAVIETHLESETRKFYMAYARHWGNHVAWDMLHPDTKAWWMQQYERAQDYLKGQS